MEHSIAYFRNLYSEEMTKQSLSFLSKVALAVQAMFSLICARNIPSSNFNKPVTINHLNLRNRIDAVSANVYDDYKEEEDDKKPVVVVVEHHHYHNDHQQQHKV